MSTVFIVDVSVVFDNVTRMGENGTDNFLGICLLNMVKKCVSCQLVNQIWLTTYDYRV